MAPPDTCAGPSAERCGLHLASTNSSRPALRLDRPTTEVVPVGSQIWDW